MAVDTFHRAWTHIRSMDQYIETCSADARLKPNMQKAELNSLVS